MPTPLTPLPEPFLDRPFTVHEARMAGIGRRRLRSDGLARPFAGVRAGARPDTVRDLVAAYLPKMTPPEFFSHRTAAVLHDMWLPFAHAERLRLDVAVRPPGRAPRDARVSGHHLIDRPGLVVEREGLRLANPVETWCQLATMLKVPDLVAAGDSLLAKGRPGDDLLPFLRAAVDDRSRPCSKRLLEAMALVRPGVRSAQETRVRLLLVFAGLPEPEVNGLVTSPDGMFEAECDLVYRSARVVIEYEGDQHRSDPKQWRKDVLRYERLQDLGWRVVRVTADDLRLRLITSGLATFGRIRGAEAAKSGKTDGGQGQRVRWTASAARAAGAAVEVRSTVGPIRAGIAPASIRAAVSSGATPPSGPTTSTRSSTSCGTASTSR
jgi:hypothetical protein